MADQTKDRETLIRDPLRYVERNVVPAMQKLGLNADDAADVIKFAAKVTSDRTAQEALTSLTLRRQELRSQLDEIKARGGKPEDQRAAIEGSTRLRAMAVQQQFSVDVRRGGNGD